MSATKESKHFMDFVRQKVRASSKDKDKSSQDAKPLAATPVQRPPPVLRRNLVPRVGEGIIPSSSCPEPKRKAPEIVKKRSTVVSSPTTVTPHAAAVAPPGFRAVQKKTSAATSLRQGSAGAGASGSGLVKKQNAQRSQTSLRDVGKSSSSALAKSKSVFDLVPAGLKRGQLSGSPSESPQKYHAPGDGKRRRIATSPQGKTAERPHQRTIPENYKGPRFMDMNIVREIAQMEQERAAERIRQRNAAASKLRPLTKRAKILKAVRDPQTKVKKQWKGLVQDFTKLLMASHMKDYMRANRIEAAKKTPDKTPEIEKKPGSEFKALKRVDRFRGLPCTIRPPSIATIESILGDSDKSSARTRRRLSAGTFSVIGRQEVDEQQNRRRSTVLTVNSGDEDKTVRASLLPFQDLVTLVQTSTVHSPEEIDRLAHNRTPRQSDFLGPRSSLSSPSSILSSHLSNHPALRHSLDDNDDNHSQASSEDTITPLTYRMSCNKPSSTKNPASESKEASGSLRMDRAKASSPSPSDTKTLSINSTFSRDVSNMRQSLSLISREENTQYGGYSDNDSVIEQQSRNIHALASLTRKGTGSTPEFKSALPLPVRRYSEEHMSSLLSSTAPKGAFGGIRTTKPARGPQLRTPVDEEGSFVSFAENKQSAADKNKSIKDKHSDKEFDEMSTPSTSRSFAYGASGEPRKTSTVFTGEYRSRPSFGARVASDEIATGEYLPQRSALRTQKTNNDKTKSFDGPEQATKDSVEQPSSSGLGQKDPSSIQEVKSRDVTPKTHNFSRPHAALEHGIPVRDFSGRELTITRKPSNKNPLVDLYEPPHEEEEQTQPVVPSIPEQYVSDRAKLMQIPEPHPGTPFTPKKRVDQASAMTSGKAEIARHSSGKASGNSDPIESHPPRESSLGSTTITSMSRGTEPNEPVVPQNPSWEEQWAASRNTTFDNMLPENMLTTACTSTSTSPTTRTQESSKGVRVLDSFRSIIKGKLDKPRGKRGGPRISRADIRVITTPVPQRLGPGGTMEAATTTTPMTAIRSFPVVRETETPSFARPTRSSRASAVVPKAPTRRARVSSSSTGSPQLTRVSRPGVEDPLGSGSQSSEGLHQAADGPEMGPVEAARVCIEDLCTRARDEATGSQRDQLIKLALAAQERLSGYLAAEEAAREAEETAKQKQRELLSARAALLEQLKAKI